MSGLIPREQRKWTRMRAGGVPGDVWVQVAQDNDRTFWWCVEGVAKNQFSFTTPDSAPSPLEDGPAPQGVSNHPGVSSPLPLFLSLEKLDEYRLVIAREYDGYVSRWLVCIQNKRGRRRAMRRLLLEAIDLVGAIRATDGALFMSTWHVKDEVLPADPEVYGALPIPTIWVRKGDKWSPDPDFRF